MRSARLIRAFVQFAAPVGVALSGAPAHASGLPGFDPSQYADPSSMISQDLADALVTTLGLSTDDRPYEPATALGTQLGLGLGVELSLAKVPQKLIDALAETGIDFNLPIVPVPRLQLHKGLGSRAAIGGSWVRYQGYRLWGADFQLTVYQPEEGPTYAIRFCYSNSALGFARTQTYSPEVLVSRALDFADPYIGIGYRRTFGKLAFSQELAGMTFPFEKKGSGADFLAFLGVQFRVAVTGLQLTLEGSYSSAGVHTLGTKFGFRF